MFLQPIQGLGGFYPHLSTTRLRHLEQKRTAITDQARPLLHQILNLHNSRLPLQVGFF